MDNDLRRVMSIVSETDSPSENTPTHGEHFPAVRGPGWSRWQVFGPIAAGVLVVGAAYGWSLQSPRTIAGLKAGGQPIGDVPYTQLDGALDKVANQFLDTRIVIAIGTDQ